jgi:hypothetical protein
MRFGDGLALLGGDEAAFGMGGATRCGVRNALRCIWDAEGCSAPQRLSGLKRR